ncbi:unnamed protein product, partial [Iphiclides podalirius]
MTKPNNNPNEIDRSKRIFTIYPNKESKFDVYEDDRISSDYLKGRCATTEIVVNGPRSNSQGDLLISIDKTRGEYEGMIKERSTLLQIMASKDVDQVKAAVNGETMVMTKANGYDDFERSVNAYYFKEDFEVNPYLSSYNVLQSVLLIKVGEHDVTTHHVQIKVSGYANEGKVFGEKDGRDERLDPPKGFKVLDDALTPTTITVHWSRVDEASYYEIERDGVVFSNLQGDSFTFEGFEHDTKHVFRVRAAKDGVSEWSERVEVQTLQDPYRSVVKGVRVACNIPCQPCQEICHLTNGDLTSLWHTHWHKTPTGEKKGEALKLSFDLGDVYELARFEYTPREDAGNGTFLKIRHKYSVDGEKWSPLSDTIAWVRDASVKSVDLYGAAMRYIEIHILDTVGGFGSGRQMRFFKKV